MRIVYLNPCGHMGGAETSLLELLASVRKAEPGWELHLVLGEDGPLADKARELGVDTAVIPFRRALARVGDAGGRPGAAMWSLLMALGPTAAYARSLAAWIRTNRPDVIHSNGLKMHVLASWVRPAHAALIWHIHDYVNTRPLMRRLLRLRRKRCTAAIANSNSVAGGLRGILPGVPVETIYNAIDVDRFTPAGKTLNLDRLSGLAPAAPGTVRVGLLATFARWKGHGVFLKALALLPKDLPVRGYVIGGPIYRTGGSQHSLAELQQQADQLGLEGRVGFAGFQDDSAAALRSLDIVVHASTQPEPFGMVIIEGMACGKAVIASQAGGASELFTDGVNALSHAPGDARELAGQIERLARNEELRHHLGAAGRASVQQLFRGERLAGELLTLYRQLSEQAGAPVSKHVAREPQLAAPAE